MKKIDYISIICTIIIFVWLLFYAFFSVVFLYENHDIKRTFSINTNEKMLSEIFQTISLEDFSLLYSSKDADSVRGIKNKLPRGLFFMYPKLIFFGTSPRVAYASVQPFNESIYIPDAPNAIIPIGSQSFVFSRATLLNRDFVTFWIMELIWCIGCGVLLTRKKLLITTWQHNRMAFFFLFVLNGINGMIFLYTQPPVWDYFPRKTQERNEYYRKSLFDSQNSFAEQNVKTRANTLHQVFILPQNSNGAAFQWIEISPFEYLYHISEKPESVLPYSDKGISITNEGSGFYKVTYWQERLLWHWGLLPGCILVWCIILWSIQAALKVLMESKKYLKA